MRDWVSKWEWFSEWLMECMREWRVWMIEWLRWVKIKKQLVSLSVTQSTTHCAYLTYPISLLIHSLSHSVTQSLALTYYEWVIHLLTSAHTTTLTHSLTHSITHSLIHLLTELSIQSAGGTHWLTNSPALARSLTITLSTRPKSLLTSLITHSLTPITHSFTLPTSEWVSECVSAPHIQCGVSQW